MENVHGVDVSWLHRPQKDALTRSRAPSSPAAPQKDLLASPRPPHPQSPSFKSPSREVISSENDGPAPLTRVNTAPATPTLNRTNGAPPSSTISDESTTTRPMSRRPTLLSRSSSQNQGNESGKPGRRGSWMTNISSRFSSTSQPIPSTPATPQVSKPVINNGQVTSPKPDLGKPAVPQSPRKEQEEQLQPYVPAKPKESSSNFFSSITRRLSTNAQMSGPGRPSEHGGVCPRRVLNVNPNRARCLLPELEHAKLRRVSFSVDVEIAGGPKYKDDDDPGEKVKQIKDKKSKERAEGEALKHPQAASNTKNEEEGNIVVRNTPSQTDNKDMSEEESLNDKDSKSTTRKQEKKKQSEAERKDRKEKKRKKAEENGQIPVELRREDDDSKNSSPHSSLHGAHTEVPKPNDRPTTDPVRIYRRCCQLRESPILKRITEQLMKPDCTMPGDSGTVTCLNLAGSRLQLADFVTLGDWLAIVPVRRLLIDDADITDEGLRVVLAGLLASKKPEPTRSRHSMSQSHDLPAERSGVIERLNLKNNPRIGRAGWKHLALFLNMCTSIKAVDLSMIQFPDDLPPGAQVSLLKNQGQSPSGPLPDAADIFAKALAERHGGNTLEELLMNECGLGTEQIRKVVAGVTKCGITRLGLAGNQLNDEGFEHVLSYVRSGVCAALDIGSNDLTGKLHLLADALTNKPDCPIWGLSLAASGLDATALKPLFPALVKLRGFRFLDISHNKDLFENNDAGGVQLLRKFIPLLKYLKRIHLVDCGLNAKQAIALAEVLPEGPSLAHLSLLENTELSKLVYSTDESSQEEACALYASLMVAVRVSKTIVCIDIDVPPPNNSEVVKALAKQVVAYCLRNMELMPLSEATGRVADIAHSGTDKNGLEITVPDVLLHLVGHVHGFRDNSSGDDTAPDDDYIVGGTGVVKALQYCLGEKAQELSRRGSGQTTPINRDGDRDQEAGRALQRNGKAKEVSKNLLDSARKIRERLQSAIVKEAVMGDELAYRRLLLLDNTLEGMIQRFEDEYPECRVSVPSPKLAASITSSYGVADMSFTDTSPTISRGAHTPDTQFSTGVDSDDEETHLRASRRGSQVSLAGKALAMQEGRIHRLGHGIRQDIINASSPSRFTPTSAPQLDDAASATSNEILHTMSAEDRKAAQEKEDHLRDIEARLERMTGQEMQDLLEQGNQSGWNVVMESIGTNIAELRMMREGDPEEWRKFVEAQVRARQNMGRQ